MPTRKKCHLHPCCGRQRWARAALGTASPLLRILCCIRAGSHRAVRPAKDRKSWVSRAWSQGPRWLSQGRVCSSPRPLRPVCRGQGCRASGCITVHAGASSAAGQQSGSSGRLVTQDEPCQRLQGQAAPRPASVSSRSHVQLGMMELPPPPLSLPKPDARVTLALPSLTSSILCWHMAHRCLWAHNSASNWMEIGHGQLPPASLPPAAPLFSRSPFHRTPGTSQPGSCCLKVNTLHLTCKAPGGWEPACRCLG